ncbi:hypothetical protein GCM10023063_19610 [Arthrobacter methylotrophus]|uniref:Uncharacterized protein n=1 Tax=Arthrobacter methylotrophus TaxID=121291 RepID=A0ABV5UPM6_9MICC
MSIFGSRKRSRALLIVLISVVVWSIAGYLIGGWAQVLFFGLVIGGIFALFGLFVAFGSDKIVKDPRRNRKEY